MPARSKWDLVDRDLYRKCGHSGDSTDDTIIDFRWVAVKHRSGNITARRQCLVCGYVSGRQETNHDVEALPLVIDATGDAPPCERCASTNGVELHHWAPRAVFPRDSDDWPTSWLCRECHREWHRRMGRGGDG